MASHPIDHDAYMQRALQLACLGVGNVSPNPMVGCVIVHHGQIIGEGYHQTYGHAHAEVNAIASVVNAQKLVESILYVTLEPCCHWGKTPPCTDLIIEKKIKKVVVACLDPNPLVAGKGVKKLQDAGIDVLVGVCEAEAKNINRRFFTYVLHKRPYIILKWAQSKHGYMGRADAPPVWLSHPKSKQLVHKWRTQEDAVLIGYQTALADNPQLTARLYKGRNPKRVIIDAHAALQNNLHIFEPEAPTFIFTTKKNSQSSSVQYVQIARMDVDTILSKLAELGICSVIVEGGAKTLQKFLEANGWDEARVFYTSHNLQEGIKAPEMPRGESTIEKIGDDTLLIFKNELYLKTL